MTSPVTLSRQAASDAVGDIGWRFVLGTYAAVVRVGSLSQAANVAVAVASDAEPNVAIDLRTDCVLFTLQCPVTASVTQREVELAHGISAAVAELGLRTEPGTARSVQALEIGIDAMDIAAIRPFWKAVLGYAPEAGADGPKDPLIDPLGQGPAIWFQQMDAPRPQRNRIHFDVSVPHDEAQRRIAGALAAGGVMVSDSQQPAFWVLADIEGNEACVTTWQGRE